VTCLIEKIFSKAIYQNSGEWGKQLTCSLLCKKNAGMMRNYRIFFAKNLSKKNFVFIFTLLFI